MLAASVNDCCSPCIEPTSVAVPGPQGDSGADGTDGTDGVNSYTTADSFVMPAELANVTVTAVSSAWMGIGQIVFASGGGFHGFFEVISKADTTHAVLKNLESAATSAYLSNSPAGTIFPALTTIVPGGLQGIAGVSTGAPSTATYVTITSDAGLSAEVPLAGMGSGVLDFDDGTDTLGTTPKGVADGNIVRVDDALGLILGEAVFATSLGIQSLSVAAAIAALGLGTMATQNATTVAITGGVLNGTVGSNTPNTGVFTTLSTSGDRTESGRVIQTPSSLQTLLVATAISANAAKIRVVGSPGAVTLTATPTISAGSADGQRLLIKGTSATLTVTLQDEASLAGTTLELGAATRALGLNSQIELSWDSTSSKWIEISYSAN